MAAQIPTSEPLEITLGETEVWTKELEDYPPSAGWTLTYYLRGGNPGLDITAITDPDNAGRYKASITPAQSATLIVGRYDWQAWVSKGSGASLERHNVQSGFLTAKIGFVGVTNTTAHDGRSQVKQDLDAIRAALARTATTAQLRRTIGNTSIEFMTPEQLIVAETKFQQLYNQELQAERIRSGAPFMTNVNIRFT